MSSTDGRNPRSVEMPPASWGQCRVRRCWVIGDLAVGLCVDHWDRGLDRQDKEDKHDESAVE